MAYTIKTKTEAETNRVGQVLGSLLKSGDFVILKGDLGAGKTALSKGVAKGMGITDHITSPTFTIIQEYDGPVPLFHFDVYRLSDWWELEDLGYEDYFYGSGVCLVEWPQQVEPLLPRELLEIAIEPGSEEPIGTREITLVAKGKRYEELLARLDQELIEELKKNC